jgi:hypothetical protein
LGEGGDPLRLKGVERTWDSKQCACPPHFFAAAAPAAQAGGAPHQRIWRLSMSRFAKLTLAAAAAVCLAVGAHASDPTGSAGKNSVQALSTAHKLLKSYFETDAPGSALAAGSFTTVGAVLNVNCGNTAGCTIAANMNAQLAAGASENSAAICMRVDGGYVNCPYNAIIRAGSGFQVMNYQTFTSVPLGNHTVEMVVFTTQASTLHRYNKEFKVYKP